MFVTLPSDISSMVIDELVEDKVVLEPHHLNTELSLLSGQDSHKYSRISAAHGGCPVSQPHLPGPQGRHLLAGGGVGLVGQGCHDVAAGDE